ncbi:MAG: NAD(P)-dependent oxidoreductase [Nanoarchaeota archaeon]|nr:NAD(P)-dependent oxidoreductase [Nanoarchaeota archaeon]
MKFLVTGTTGSVGSSLVKKLLEQGHIVIPAKREFYKEGGKDIDALFHLAADVRGDNMFINYQAPIKLFEKVIKNGCRRIVYASSTAVYGNTPTPFKEGQGENPLNNYGKAKLLLDQKAMELEGAIIVGLRFCNIYGIKGSMIDQISQQVEPFLYNFGGQRRDYIHIQDATRGLTSALNAKESCVLNCAGGKAFSFNEICRILGKKKIKYIGGAPKDFQTNTICDITLAKEKIGFSPKISLKKH